jgi:hypothetical protein
MRTTLKPQSRAAPHAASALIFLHVRPKKQELSGFATNESRGHRSSCTCVIVTLRERVRGRRRERRRDRCFRSHGRVPPHATPRRKEIRIRSTSAQSLTCSRALYRTVHAAATKQRTTADRTVHAAATKQRTTAVTWQSPAALNEKR